MAFKVTATAGVQSKDLIENGAWMQVRAIVRPGQDEGDPIYLVGKDGKPDKTKPFRILVRSVRSSKFRTDDLRIQTLASSKAARAPRKEQDQVVEQSVASERPKRFSFLAISFENAASDAEPIQTPTREELYEYALQGEAQFVVDQVMRFAFDDLNYGTQAEVDAATRGNEQRTVDDEAADSALSPS